MKLAEVTWLDTHSTDAWSDVPNDYAPLAVTSVGYIREFANGVVLVSNLVLQQPASEELCFGVVHIPQGCIKRIRYFEE
jgi:hypothetical protein